MQYKLRSHQKALHIPPFFLQHNFGFNGPEICQFGLPSFNVSIESVFYYVRNWSLWCYPRENIAFYESFNASLTHRRFVLQFTFLYSLWVLRHFHGGPALPPSYSVYDTRLRHSQKFSDCVSFFVTMDIYYWILMYCETV